MRTRNLDHLTNSAVLRRLDVIDANEFSNFADMLACLAQVDARRLYLAEGFPSLYQYCVGKRGWPEPTALKRMRAARLARRFPVILDAVGDGRLYLSGVILLARHLTPDNVDSLVAASANQTNAAIERLLARRFPKPDVPTRIEAVAPAPHELWTEVSRPSTVESPTVEVSVRTPAASEPSDSPVPEPASSLMSPPTESPAAEVSVRTPAASEPNHFPSPVEQPIPRPRLKPLAPQRFAIQFTIGQEAHDKLRHVQELLGHAVPSGDLAQVFERALDALIPKLEKQKFAATSKPRPQSRRPNSNPRHIPADVKRAVRKRDEGQCTYVSEDGHRCAERKSLEFDHITPVARGGQTTTENLRLRCRPHNQYEAERLFGSGFMAEKREAARRTATARMPLPRAEGEARAPAVHTEQRAWEVVQDHSRDIMAGLRELGFRAEQARRAVEYSETLHGATLEERMRAALQFLGPKKRALGGGNGLPAPLRPSAAFAPPPRAR